MSIATSTKRLIATPLLALALVGSFAASASAQEQTPAPAPAQTGTDAGCPLDIVNGLPVVGGLVDGLGLGLC